ncbi:Tfp pilus assembly protein PilF [Chryseobacterium soldanellicola]|uniref:Tfp pilus assembly protein PilF n=1 Tax=Chryseobacterium soldanellicola TaxID=311333 RepID=A0A1H1AYE2_9FLAO|nr:tetratricopeptide repeat protein [Chryseobacterium soldanellicola]SDQ44672.1 Tfp pilus assembly protein PilF [Chryseobacterium soldanellicola]
MNKDTIEYLAYLLNEAKNDEGREKAIVFLGAGVSVSAGIPLTGTIVEDIKVKFSNNPIIKDCIKNKKDDYYSLMGALTADERRDLFHFYVTRDEVKLNLANIYLAQLLKLGYVDYIVTVNFDDLILKACTLFNFLPPVYDISNIKTITTTDIRKGSVIYLHGQYFGQWLLNNPDELKKVEDEVLRLFNAIKTRRTWIVVGYSGNDGIFDKIKSLGSFSSELFWIKHKFSESDKTVVEFLETPNINAHKIEEYYADSFFLKLHAELSVLNKNLEAPEIITKPFTFVKSVLQSINEISEDDELNDNVKKMLVNCNGRIDKAVTEYEEEGTLESLKQRIIDTMVKAEFNNDLAEKFEKEIIEKSYDEANVQLSTYYDNWGNLLFQKANKERKISSLLYESVQKYEKAALLNPLNDSAFNNWGAALSSIGRLENNEDFLFDGLERLKKAIEINPKNHRAYNNYGLALFDLGFQSNNAELFEESVQKFEKALEFGANNRYVLNNWANSLLELAKIKKDINLITESLKKFDEALSLDPKNSNALNNKARALFELGKELKDSKYYDQGLGLLLDGYNLSGNSYNLSCAYALLSDKENALKYLKESLDKNEINLEDINRDNDWKSFKRDNDFINLLNEYR